MIIRKKVTEFEGQNDWRAALPGLSSRLHDSKDVRAANRDLICPGFQKYLQNSS